MGRHFDGVTAEPALALRELDQDLGRERRLRIAMDDIGDRWDVVLIHCPPSLGQLTVNALTAADTAALSLSRGQRASKAWPR